MTRLTHTSLFALALLATPALATTTLAEPTLPDFAAADFSAPAENPFMPLRVGLTETMVATRVL